MVIKFILMIVGDLCEVKFSYFRIRNVIIATLHFHPCSLCVRRPLRDRIEHPHAILMSNDEYLLSVIFPLNIIHELTNTSFHLLECFAIRRRLCEFLKRGSKVCTVIIDITSIEISRIYLGNPCIKNNVFYGQPECLRDDLCSFFGAQDR